jgi:hypothetical protein
MLFRLMRCITLAQRFVRRVFCYTHYTNYTIHFVLVRKLCSFAADRRLSPATNGSSLLRGPSSGLPGRIEHRHHNENFIVFSILVDPIERYVTVVAVAYNGDVCASFVGCKYACSCTAPVLSNCLGIESQFIACL